MFRDESGNRGDQTFQAILAVEKVVDGIVPRVAPDWSVNRGVCVSVEVAVRTTQEQVQRILPDDMPASRQELMLGYAARLAGNMARLNNGESITEITKKK